MSANSAKPTRFNGRHRVFGQILVLGEREKNCDRSLSWEAFVQFCLSKEDSSVLRRQGQLDALSKPNAGVTNAAHIPTHMTGTDAFGVDAIMCSCGGVVTKNAPEWGIHSHRRPFRQLVATR